MDSDLLGDLSSDIDGVAHAGNAHVRGVLLDYDTADAAQHRGQCALVIVVVSSHHLILLELKLME